MSLQCAANGAESSRDYNFSGFCSIYDFTILRDAESISSFAWSHRGKQQTVLFPDHSARSVIVSPHHWFRILDSTWIWNVCVCQILSGKYWATLMWRTFLCSVVLPIFIRWSQTPSSSLLRHKGEMRKVHISRIEPILFQVKELPSPYEGSKCRTESRKLKFFQTYSFGACNLECFADFSLLQCGCKAFGLTG